MNFQLTGLHILFSFLLWSILIFAYRKNFYSRIDNADNYKLFLLVVIVYSTFGFCTGDYPNYAELYERITRTTNIRAMHMEDFYIWLIEILPNDYNLWRFFVWGLSTIVAVWTFKKYRLNSQFACLIFALMLMQYFAAPRNSLGYMVLFLGVAWLFYPKHKTLATILIGILIILSSTFFHKSMFLYILVICISLIPFKKSMYIISLILFPVLYISFIKLSVFILPYIAGDTESLSSGMMYLEKDEVLVANFNGLIRLLIQRTPIFILVFLAVKSIIFKGEKIPYVFKVLLNYTYILIYISMLFYGQKTSGLLSTRFWDASIYSVMIFTAYYFYSRPSKLLTKCLFLLLFANFFDFAYLLYAN